ncbi:ThiF family adenylyltransferase [Natrinema sp. 1APR25-10V2]|uniref:HesA/MoeB/ThiF family protein n=1 Tax=Natrinema sp. 1APR25-10V2 TaxID=2951081 RepID=UPI0028747B26|nr:ThiF family adenylyltransferase [Natrinema sp. 1APR25-10V2]MDS0476811.1 ThiF family adenylyltransferase [Natrinema sp. 1APR25-10V2]
MSKKSDHTSSDSTNPFAPDHSATRPETYIATAVTPDRPDQAGVTDRQERIPGFDQSTVSGATVLLVGAGGVGGLVGRYLTWKGVGTLEILDEDIVDYANLSRQPYRDADVGRNKAVALARLLAQDGACDAIITGYPYHFEDAVALGYTFDPDIVVCCPDNDMARLAVAARFYGETPVVITGLDDEANGGYVFVQDPDSACFQCFRPDAGGAGACPGAPAVVDPALVIAGLALYAVDSTLMDRARTWDVTELWLSGELPPVVATVDQRPDCTLCGGG